MTDAKHVGALVVRLLRRGDPRPAGVGFLVGPSQVLTCAHVVNSCLGRDRRTQEAPGREDTIALDLPLIAATAHAVRSATVTVWRPPPHAGRRRRLRRPQSRQRACRRRPCGRAIPADLLAEAWPDVLMSPQVRSKQLPEPSLRKRRSWLGRGEAVVDLSVDADVAFGACARAVQALDPARFSADPGRRTVRATTRSRLSSWGLRLSVSLEALAPAETRVTIHLTPLVRTTVATFGRVERELATLLAALGVGEHSLSAP